MSGETLTRSLSAAKLALAVKRLRLETEGIGLLASEPLAIIGMSCHLPGGVETPEDFWRILVERRSTIREMPVHRWRPNQFLAPHLRLGGYFDDISSFDADFFGIAPREAETIDPQHRLLLETTWDALLDAGIPPESLSGTATGVFVAVSNSDYARMQLRDVSSTTACPGMGAAHCMASGRLAFLLNIHGPNTVVDTACSSSLVAAHLASQSLRNRETDLAIVSAANLKTLPDEVISFDRWGMLAKDGRCKTFDAEADGFVPGEGSGTIIIKRLSDALADGNRIRAVIRGSAINHDGRTTVLSAPSGLAQQSVIRTALRNAQIAPEDVSFIETHGTGTALGDPIEVEALRPTYDVATAPTCALGAVKTNIGHLETAAGIAGMIKVVLALENGVIPPNLNFEQLNSVIDLTRSRFKLPLQAIPWSRSSSPRIAGLSSFGMGGSNAHFLIEEAPQQPASVATLHPAPYLLAISTKSSASLRAAAELYATLLVREQVQPWTVCASAALHRSHLSHRLAVSGKTNEELAQRLQAFAAGRPHSSTQHGVCNPSQHLKLAFVFSGQGSTWVGMGRSLLETEPVALAAMKAVDEIFVRLANWSLIEELSADNLDQHLRRTDIAQPLIFAVQVALTSVLATRGIVPAAVTGHSVGEVAAAYISGLLTLEDAVSVIYHRGRVMQMAGTGSRMLAVALSASEAAELLSRHDGLTIAAFNAPRSHVVAGPREAIETAQAELATSDIFHRLVDVDFAFHTAQMDKAAIELVATLDRVTNGQPQVPFISSQTGQAVKANEATAAYWAAGIRQPVRFQSAIDNLLASGFTTFVELGSRPVLTHDIQECAKARGIEVLNIATMRPSQSSGESLLDSTALLYVHGTAIHWRSFFPGRIPVAPLPAYPWQRKPYWIDESEPSPAPIRNSSALGVTQWWLGEEVISPFIDGTLFVASFNNAVAEWLASYRIGDERSIPLGLWLSAAIHALAHGQPGKPLRLSQWTLPHPSAASEKALRIQIHVTHEAVEIAEVRQDGWETMLTAQIAFLDSFAIDTLSFSTPAGPELLETWKNMCSKNIPTQDFYSMLEYLGLFYGPSFRPIEKLWTGSGMALSHLHLEASLIGESPEHVLHPVLLEGALQTVCAALGQSINAPYLPKTLSRFDSHSSATDLWVLAIIAEVNEETKRADIIITDSQGTTCAIISGLELRRQALTVDFPLPTTVSLREDLRRLSSEKERQCMLTEHVTDCVRVAMGQDEDWRIAEDQPLHEVGLDSLMGITLRNMLSVSLGQELRATFAFDHPTIASITQYLETMLWIADEAGNQDKSDLNRDEIRL